MLFFFFKQKTAYEMACDWSSDVCSSDLDDHLFALLHSPIYNSILLLGLASASLILAPPQLTLNIIFSVIQTLALVVWATFFLRANRMLLTRISRIEDKIKIVHSQTLPLFLNLINIIIVVMAVYFLFSAWHIDMTRSEEHTSELQSQAYVVCRLLLEKKNPKTFNIN